MYTLKFEQFLNHNIIMHINIIFSKMILVHQDQTSCEHVETE